MRRREPGFREHEVGGCRDLEIQSVALRDVHRLADRLQQPRVVGGDSRCGRVRRLEPVAPEHLRRLHAPNRPLRGTVVSTCINVARLIVSSSGTAAIAAPCVSASAMQRAISAGSRARAPASCTATTSCSGGSTPSPFATEVGALYHLRTMPRSARPSHPTERAPLSAASQPAPRRRSRRRPECAGVLRDSKRTAGGRRAARATSRPARANACPCPAHSRIAPTFT